MKPGTHRTALKSWRRRISPLAAVLVAVLGSAGLSGPLQAQSTLEECREQFVMTKLDILDFRYKGKQLELLRQSLSEDLRDLKIAREIVQIRFEAGATAQQMATALSFVSIATGLYTGGGVGTGIKQTLSFDPYEGVKGLGDIVIRLIQLKKAFFETPAARQEALQAMEEFDTSIDSFARAVRRANAMQMMNQRSLDKAQEYYDRQMARCLAAVEAAMSETPPDAMGPETGASEGQAGAEPPSTGDPNVDPSRPGYMAFGYTRESSNSIEPPGFQQRILLRTGFESAKAARAAISEECPECKVATYKNGKCVAVARGTADHAVAESKKGWMFWSYRTANAESDDSIEKALNSCSYRSDSCSVIAHACATGGP